MRNTAFLLLLIISATLSAKNIVPDTLLMKISVSEILNDAEGNYNLNGSYITIYQHGEEIGATDSLTNGQFSIALVLLDTAQYTLVAYKPGFVPKRILITPSKNLAAATGHTYQMQIDFYIFRMKKGEDYTFWRQPLNKIYFKNAKEGFVFDDVYGAYMNYKINEEMIRLSQSTSSPGRFEKDPK
jgi:hypothetical protein